MKRNGILPCLWRLMWICIVVLPGYGFATEQGGTGSSPAATQLVVGYTKWSKANKKPVFMDSVFAGLCNASPYAMKKLDEADPHKNKYVNVYVNESGYNEFISKRKPQFPEGTVIVKEKLPQTNSAPELLTVMVKRKAGFDAKNGDWEYFAFDGQGTKLLSETKTQNCQECHEMRKDEDFVFRRELGPDIWRAMK